MDSLQTEEASDESPRWAVGRRRKLIAFVVGLTMLAIVTDSSDSESSSVVKQSSDEVMADEFDRIEALLATAENQRVEGRGPTVEVPSDIAFEDKRPAFDFDAFDNVTTGGAISDEAMSGSETQHSELSASINEGKEKTDRQAPRRDTFDDRNQVTQLQIPEQLALGSGHQVLEPSSKLADLGLEVNDAAKSLHISEGDFNLRQKKTLNEPAGQAAVRILASDVTASKVTRFEPATDLDPVESSGRIRFTGLIFPVSRGSNER